MKNGETGNGVIRLEDGHGKKAQEGVKNGYAVKNQSNPTAQDSPGDCLLEHGDSYCGGLAVAL